MERSAPGGTWRLEKTIEGIDFLNLPPNAWVRVRRARLAPRFNLRALSLRASPSAHAA
jgi:hypothetical protein